jgi:hypothetical protein
MKSFPFGIALCLAVWNVERTDSKNVRYVQKRLKRVWKYKAKIGLTHQVVVIAVGGVVDRSDSVRDHKYQEHFTQLTACALAFFSANASI